MITQYNPESEAGYKSPPHIINQTVLQSAAPFFVMDKLLFSKPKFLKAEMGSAVFL
jgi:hypothetical protein